MKQASFILYFAPDRRPIHRRFSLPLPLPLPPTHPLSCDRKESKYEGKNSVLGYNGNLVDFHWTITVFSRGKEGNGKFHLCWFVSHFTAENRFGSFVRYDGADFMFRRLIVTVIWFNLGSGSWNCAMSVCSYYTCFSPQLPISGCSSTKHIRR